MVNRFLTFRLFCWENVRGGRHFILGARDEDEEEEGGRGGEEEEVEDGKEEMEDGVLSMESRDEWGPCFLIYGSMGSVLTVKSDKYPPRDDKLRIRNDTRGFLCWRVRGWVIRDSD